jgi:hypothetical protein
MRRVRVAAMLLLSLVALSCSAPSGNDRSGPGTVQLRFQTPNSGDGAIKFTLNGPGITGVVAAGDLMVYSRLGAGNTTTVAVFGDLADGLIVTFDVPDVAALDDYIATLLQVAGPDNTLRTSLTGYGVTIEY